MQRPLAPGSPQTAPKLFGHRGGMVNGQRAVSPTIYLGRPDMLDLPDNLDFVEIGETLHDAAKAATEITILGGFYNIDALESLCANVPKRRRKACRVRIAVGLEGTAVIPRTWDDMRGLRRRLVELGFANPEVAIVDCSPVHFHTKLFRFLHTMRPLWFVGSANPGSSRHELMIRVAGRHEGLSAYVTAVFEKAVNVDAGKPEARISSLRDFFMSGVLCHKPPPQRLFTFDAFEFDAGQREALAVALGGRSQVSHASPKTQGFAFDLRSALGRHHRADRAHEAEARGRSQVRTYSIDTVFGWWMPRVYSKHIESGVARSEAARAARLCDLGELLSERMNAVRSAFDDHVRTMNVFLKTHRIEARPSSNRGSRFERFLASRLAILGDRDAVRRHARSMIFTDMPDIWGDGRAVREFEHSFFEDLAYRAIGAKQPRAVKSILSWLGDETLVSAKDLAKALARGLAEEPWSDDAWY